MNANSVFGKLRTIGLGNLHELLDRVIDLNSPAAVRQMIRDLKTSAAVIDDSITKAIASNRTLASTQRDKSARVAQLETVITHILTDNDPTNDSAARPKMAEKLRLEEDLKALTQDIAQEGETRGVLERAKTVLDSRIGELEGRLHALENAEHRSAAKEEAAGALAQARDILDKAPGSQLESSLQRAEARNTVADVRLEREMARVDTSVDTASQNAEVDAALAEFKKGLQKPAAAA